LIGVAEVLAVAADAAIAAVNTASAANGISFRMRILSCIPCPPLSLVVRRRTWILQPTGRIS